jgi:hypothetical protein
MIILQVCRRTQLEQGWFGCLDGLAAMFEAA